MNVVDRIRDKITLWFNNYAHDAMVHGLTHEWDALDALPEYVLAALKPGDKVGVHGDVVVTKSFAESVPARQAREETRERCKEIVNKHVGNFYDREETIAAIRALTLEE